jgi:hypothetical protein
VNGREGLPKSPELPKFPKFKVRASRGPSACGAFVAASTHKDPMSKAGLNEHHLRRLSTAMATLDAAGARLLDLLEGQYGGSPLTVMEDSLSAPEREKIKAGLQRLRPLLLEFARKNNLRASPRDLRRVMVAEISRMWTILEDLHAKKLRGMGTVPAAIAAEIDSDVDRMLAIVKELREALMK